MVLPVVFSLALDTPTVLTEGRFIFLGTTPRACFHIEPRAGFEPAALGFEGQRSVRTELPGHKECLAGYDPAAPTMARWCSAD